MNDNPYPTLFPLDCRQKPIHVHLSQMSELTLLLLSKHISHSFISPFRHHPLPFSLFFLFEIRHPSGTYPFHPPPEIHDFPRLLRAIKRRRLPTVTDDALHARTPRLHADRLVG